VASSFDQRQAVRKQRLDRLEQAVKDYVKEEQTRIDTEVAVLQQVAEGRRGGQGAAGDAAQVVSKLAVTELGWFLRGY
jgi:hypothetical protein